MHHSTIIAIVVLSILISSGSTSPLPQFGFLGNFFGGFLGNRGPTSQAAPAFGAQSSGRCGGGNSPNHQFGGQNFLLSWRIGCNDFTVSQGEAFCRSNGMRAVSLDSPAKEQEFKNLLAREGQRFFWTGGRVTLGGSNISWPSGRSHNNVEWSHTGGAGRAQPDNREGNESCLAVLNNFYNDGVKFHDIGCSHKKPIVCES